MDKTSLKKYYSGREWLYDKYEYYDLYHSIIADNIEAYLAGTPKSVVN